MKRLISLILTIITLFLYLPMSIIAQGDTVDTPRWSQSIKETQSKNNVSMPNYYVDSQTKYVRLDYESYDAQGILLESNFYDIYRVQEHFMAPVSGDYRYYLPADPGSFWSYTSLTLNNFQNPIFKFYLTACDENGNAVSSRSAAFEIRCTDMLPTPTPAITATPRVTSTPAPKVTATPTPKKTTSPCTHSNGYTDVYKQTHYQNIKDASYHEKRDSYSRTCNTCKKVLSTEYTPWVKEVHEEDKYHYCWKCGSRDAGKTCSHDASMQSNPSFFDSRYLDVQDAYIHKKRDTYTVFCQACGDTLPNIYSDWVEEAHENNGNGYCWKCGSTFVSSQQTHQHDYAVHYDKPVLGSGIWADNGNGTHNRVEVKYQTFCTTCGAEGEHYTEYNDVQGQPHNYQESSKSIYTYKQSNGEKHTPIYSVVRKCTAVGCEAEQTVFSPGQSVNHNFDKTGKCVCEYTNPKLNSVLKWTDSVLGKKNSLTFTFDANYFFQPSTKYNHDLAILSLGMVLAVQSEGSLNNNVLNKIYSDFGFHTSGNKIYTTYAGDGINTVACTMSWREIKDNNDSYKLIAVNTRGGNYGTEWVTNFDVGSGEKHRGFTYAASILLKNIEDFCSINDIDLYNDNVKIWVTGFSRSAAVSNYVSHLLNTKYSAAGKPITDIFAYTFATPNNTIAKGANLTKGHENIFNIVSADDLVPMVPLQDWGYSKYGVTLSLPKYGSREASSMLTSLKEITGEYYKGNRVFQNWKDQSEAVKVTCNWIASVIEDTNNFDQEYQSVIDDVASILFGADKLASVDAKGETLDKYNAAITSAISIKLCTKVINKVVPGLGTLVGIAADNHFEYYNEVLDNSTGLFADFVKEFTKLSYEEKDLIIELITGINIEQLILYGETILTGTFGLTDAETTDSILAAIEDFMDLGGHIIATHRMETYLAWLLSGDEDDLF